MRFDKKKLQVIWTGAVAVTVVTAGIIVYRTENVFQPSGESRKMQFNQVTFPEDDEVTGQEERNQSDESSLWEKDQQDQNQNGPKEEQKAEYLFLTETLHQPAQVDENTVMNIESDQSQDVAQKGSGIDTVGDPSQTTYDITKDADHADLVIGGNTSFQPSDSENGGQGAAGAGTGGNSETPGQTGDSKDNLGNRDNESTDQDKTDQDQTDQDHPDKDDPDTPTIRPSYSDTAKDPAIDKSNPSIGISPGHITTKPYDEDEFPGLNSSESDGSVVIQKPLGEEQEALYLGQTIDRKTIFFALYTFAVGKDGVQYVWNADALDQYVRIDSVSFDGGKTWIADFPAAIPEQVEDNVMLINVSYRFSVKGKWLPKQVPYELEQNRIFVLSKALQQENAVIDESTILNSNQYPKVGSTMNLFRYQFDYFEGQSYLTSLLPGWIENGKLVSWFYPATTGRHILEPADLVPLEEGYRVELEYQWMSDDYQVGWQYNNLVYLQTLTDYDPSVEGEEGKSGAVEFLKVPKYVQAVDIPQDSVLSVDYLELPDTVVYFAYENSGLKVQRGYRVDEANPVYASTEDGMLMNKEETEILNVPYQAKTITIPASVENVSLAYTNQVKNITLEASDMEEMPNLALDRLSHCNIYMKGDLIRDFIKKNITLLAKTEGNVIIDKDNRENSYSLLNGCVVTGRGELSFIASRTASSIRLPGQVTTILPDAFQGADNVDTLLLSSDQDTLVLSPNCFRNSSLTRIYCYTRKQYDNVTAQMKQAGNAQKIEIIYLKYSKEGFAYASEQTAEGVQECTIISAPADIKSFDRELADEDGNALYVTAIGEEAFANCKNLQWIDLPESITSIGRRAFANCTALEGFLIEAKDRIAIGDGTFDGCSSLRFGASNALEAERENDYMPQIRNKAHIQEDREYYFYVPTGAEGYGWDTVNFTQASGVSSYVLYPLEDSKGQVDSRVLYGADETGKPWLALRSGCLMPQEVSLPDSTQEIYRYALSDTYSSSGTYKLNWEELEYSLGYVDDGAFYGAKLQGEIVMPMICQKIGLLAFADCDQITGFTIPGFYGWTNLNLVGRGFPNCSLLTTVTIGEFGTVSALDDDMFYGCDSLSDLYIASYSAPGLTMYTEQDFAFNREWSAEEEMERLTIHVPEWQENNYISQWRYCYAGVYVMQTDSSYISLWNKTWMELYYEFSEAPSEEQVDARTTENLLRAENRLRRMLGMDTVTVPENLYQIHESGEGMLTLAKAPVEAKVVDLSDVDTMELPFGWYLDYVGSGAFQNCNQLEQIIVPDTIGGIDTNFLAGSQTDSVNLVFQGTEPVELRNFSLDDPFSFGIDESKIRIAVPQGSEADYIDSWIYPLLGYQSKAQFKTALIAELTSDGKTPSEELLEKELAKRTLSVENRLRSMMGMSPREESPEGSVSGNDAGEVQGNVSGNDAGAVQSSVSGNDAGAVQKSVSDGNLSRERQ